MYGKQWPDFVMMAAQRICLLMLFLVCWLGFWFPCLLPSAWQPLASELKVAWASGFEITSQDFQQKAEIENKPDSGYNRSYVATCSSFLRKLHRSHMEFIFSYLIIWLAEPWPSQMNQILHCDWLPRSGKMVLSCLFRTTHCVPQEKAPWKPYESFIG